MEDEMGRVPTVSVVALVRTPLLFGLVRERRFASSLEHLDSGRKDQPFAIVE